MSYGADAVLLMEEGPEPVNVGGGVVPVTVRIDKGRDGVRRGDVQLLFEHRLSRFREPAAGGALRNGLPVRK